MKTLEIISKEEFLLQADLYRLLSKGFSYPDEKTCKDLKSMISQLKKHEKLNPVLKKMLSTLGKEIKQEEIRKEYSRIFLMGGLPVSESYCTGRFDCVSDVNGFYKAFGFTPKSGDVPDSITYELEFMSLLLLKSVLAPTIDSMEITLDAAKKFRKDHFNQFVEKFSEKLLSFNPDEYYVLLVKITGEVTKIKI